MKHDTDITGAQKGENPGEPRVLKTALLRGWRRRCPNCGGGPLFDGYVKVRDHCAACGQELSHHRADDMPAYGTILIVGHVLVAAMVTVEMKWSPPVWLHWTVWPALTLLGSLLLLPRIKGMIVGMQWALEMHGFSTRK